MEKMEVVLKKENGNYILSCKKDSELREIIIASVDKISGQHAENIRQEVEELVNENYGISKLRDMIRLNMDVEKAGYKVNLLKYSGRSLDLAMQIQYPKLYENREFYATSSAVRNKLSILNIGCTGAGKTSFILESLLESDEIDNFAESLTGMKETTACSIVYHANVKGKYKKPYDFALEVDLRDEEKIKKEIEELIADAIDEYINVVRKKATNETMAVSEVQELAFDKAKDRLKENKNKTFEFGERKCNFHLAELVEQLAEKIIKKEAVDNCKYGELIQLENNQDKCTMVCQLMEVFRKVEAEKDDSFIKSGDIPALISQHEEEQEFKDLTKTIFDELMDDKQKFEEEYGITAELGKSFELQGIKKEESTRELLRHVFGNKKAVGDADFYFISTLIEKAEFYIDTDQYASLNRELVIHDSIGMNHGQGKGEMVVDDIIERIQDTEPQIILYHTNPVTKDDYLIDVVGKLQKEHYGKNTFVVAEKLDFCFDIYAKDDKLKSTEIDIVTWEKYFSILEKYIESDTGSIDIKIGENYYICAEKEILKKYSIVETEEYKYNRVMEKILQQYEEVKLDEINYHKIPFMERLDERDVCKNLYQKYLESIKNMIPMKYKEMPWNTLEAAIDRLYANGWGFNSLRPALTIRYLLARVINESEKEQAKILDELSEKEEDKFWQKYLIEAANVAQVVLATQYQTFMFKMQRLRYGEYRENRNVTMTDERKQHLQKLYRECFKQNDLNGSDALKIVLHVAWLRTIDKIEMESAE